MFKWLQHRLKKKSRYSTSEYRGVGDSSDHIYDDNQLEVAAEAGEVETENGSLEKDSAEILKVDRIGHTQQHFSHVPRVLELPHNFQDQNCAISDIGRGTVVYSECNELSSEPYNQIAEVSTHKVKIPLPSQKQDDGVLSETQGTHNFPEVEDKMTLETLTMNSSGLSQEEEERETPPQAQDSRILPDSQDSELLSEAQEVLISTPFIQEDIASSFKIQARHNVRKEGVDSKEILPDFERICSQNEEWGSQESRVHALKKTESTHENSSVECIDNSDFMSLELFEQINEIRHSNDSQSGSVDEKIFTSSPKLKKDGSNAVVPFIGKKLGLDSENDFTEREIEIFNHYNASVSVKSSSGTEDLEDFLEFDNQSAQYNEIPLEESSARHEKAEMKTEYVPGNSEHQLSPECRKRLEPSNNLHIGEEHSTIHSHPCCPQLSCLYNQPGQLCTVLGEQYILTHVKDTPVLVNVQIENSNNAPFGCLFLWRESKPVVLAELPEGTDIYFDAVLMPDATKFIAVVIWQVTKPLISTEPYFNSYVFVEEMEELMVHFISFGKKKGLVSATIENKTEFVAFSNSVVFISGKKAEDKADILKLSKCYSHHLFANVCKFVSIDNTGKVTYDFVCSCLWSGCKPPEASQTPVLNPLMLYKNNGIFYTEGKQQLHLYCDVDAELIVNENGVFLVYERENKEITIPCTPRKIHCGNKSIVNIAGGRVKAHVRKQVSKRGNPVWNVLLIQVPEMVLPKVQEARSTNMYGWEAAAMELCSDKMSRKEITSVESALSDEAQLIEETTEQHMVKPDADIDQINNVELEPPMTVSQLHLVPSCCVNKVSGPEATISVAGMDNERYVKAALPVSKKSMENSLEDLTLMNAAMDKLGTIPVHSRAQSNHNSFNDMKEDEKNNINFRILDKLESFNQTEVRSHTHFSEYGHKPKEYPKVFKNCHGKLHWITDSKVFRIYTELHGTPYEVTLRNRALMVANGILVTVAKNTVGLPVCFDIYFDDYFLHSHHVVALWVGEKPQKAVKNRNVTYFYDIQGVYSGSDGCDMKFLVSLDDSLIPIKTSNTDRIFNSEGKQCESLPFRSSVTLHLKKSINQGPSQVHWQVLLIIVQAEQEYSDLEPLVGAQHELLPTWPASHSAAHHSLSNFTKDSNGNHPMENMELSSRNWMQQNCYTSVDLPPYIKNFAGILMLNEHDDIAIFSCLGGTALWTSVAKNSFVCVGGRIVKIKEIPLGTGLMFDAFCCDPSKFKYTAVVIWIGSRPHQAEDEDGSKYFYNVKGTFWGVTECNSEFRLLVHLNGEIQIIKCQKTGYVILPDGSIGLGELMVGEKIYVHLKQKLHLNQYLWTFLFIFIDEDSSNPSKGSHMIQNEEKISEMKSCSLNSPTISQVSSQLKNDVEKRVIEDHKNISISAESGVISEQTSFTKTDCSSRELAYYSQTKECGHTDEYITFYLKDCSGFLVVIDNNRKAIKTSFWERVTIALDEEQLVCLDSGSALSILDVPVGSLVKFDALRSGFEDFAFRPLMLWIGKRPSTAMDKCGHKYFYDVKGVYLDTYCGYFQVLLDIDNHKKCVWVKRPRHIYFCNGRKVQHGLKTMDRVIMHLKEENEADDFGIKWVALVIIVNSESKEYPLKQPHGSSQHHPIVNFTEMEQLRLKSVGVDLENENWKQDKKKDTKAVIDEVVDLEHQPLKSDLYYAQEDCQYVELEQIRTATCRDETENSYFKGNSQLEGNINNSSIEESQLECIRRADTEQEVHLSFVEEKTHLGDEVDQSHRDESQHEDTNILCGETLRQLIAKRSSEAVAMNYTTRYSTLVGNLCQESFGTSVFECDGESKIINLPSDIHQLNCRGSENHNEKSYLLVHQEIDKKTKELIYHPLAVWHAGKRCDPYILINQKLIAFDIQNELIGIINDQDDGLQYYSFKNNFAFTRKSKKNVNDFFNLVKDNSLSFYIVVEDIPPVFISGYFVDMNILLITTSLSLALASIDTLTCNISNSSQVSLDLNFELLNLLQIYEERRRSARQCKWGYSYHLYSNTFDNEHGMKLAGGCLESYSGKYAFILCDKKNTCAVCRLSNVYYQGERITSWDDIDSKFWKNFFTILFPLEKTIMTHGKNVNAVAVVAWSCSGPGLLTVHGCNMHDPTVFAYHEAAENLCPLNSELPEEPSPDLSSSRRSEEVSEIRAEELEALDCMAGSNIFSVHDTILQSSGLKRTFGEIKYFGKYLIVCTSEVDELVWCHLSDFYIEDKGCNSIEDIIKLKKQKCCLIVLHSPSVMFGGKTVNLKAVVGFFKSEEKLPGIHICSEHSGILLNSIKGEMLAIAKKNFSDIQQICEHTDESAEYLLENLCNSREENVYLAADMKTTSHVECQGVFVSVNDADPNKGMACIQYQGKEHYVPVLLEVFLSLNKDLSLHTVIGCVIKVMIGVSKSSEKGKKKLRVVMAWIDLNHLCNLSLNLTTTSKVCSPSVREKRACCSRAFIIRHFESVLKTSIFEMLLGYKISSDYENNMVLFKCSQGVDNLLVACKKESLMSPDDSVDDECPWHLLVHLPSRKNLHAKVQDGVGAWKGNVADLVVLICDIHKIQLMDLNFSGGSKNEDTFLIWSLPTLGECSCESLCKKPVPSLSSLVKNKPDKSDPAISIAQAFSSSPSDRVLWSHGSSPGGINSTSLSKEYIETSPSSYTRLLCCSKSMPDLRNQEEMHSFTTKPPRDNENVTVKDNEDVTVTSQLMTEEAVLTYQAYEDTDKHSSFNGITEITDEEFYGIHLTKTSHTVESAVSDMKTEKDPDQSLEGHSMLYVESCKFEFVNEYQGIIKSSGMTILVRNHRLYINMVIQKEPLTELLKEEENINVQAMVVSLLSPVTVMGYTVTHKAIVAWLGRKPLEVNSLVKSYQDSHRLQESDPEQEDPSVSPEEERRFEKSGERNKELKFLQVYNDVPQTLRDCNFIDSNAIFGTLRSGTEYILFLRELVYLKKRQIEAHVDMKTALSLKCINAVILKLKQHIDVLECQVTNIALLVWIGKIPKDFENIIKDSLDIYREDWTVELHKVQHGKIPEISAKPDTIQQIEEDHEENDTLKQSIKDFAQDYPGRSQTWDLENMESLEERNKCSDISGGNIEVILKDASTFECVPCGILSVRDDFAVLKTRSKVAVARKQEFYLDNTKMLPSLPLHEQLKNVRSVGAFVTEIAQPVYVQQFTITDFALLAFGGKKPKAAESILATWKGQNMKKVNLIEKMELKPTSETELTLSYFKFKGKNIETNTARVYKLMSGSGILEVQSKEIEGEKVRVFFSRGQVYIDKKAIPEDKSLSKLMGQLRKEPWGCVARLFPKKNPATVRKISGVEVHYLAVLVWYGMKPSKKDMQGEPVEKSTEQKSMEMAESHVSLHPKSGRKSVAKNMAVPSSREESDIIVRNSSNPEIYKAESVAERLRRQVHNIQDDLEMHPTSRAKCKAETSSVSSWSSEEKTGTRKGCITELCGFLGLLRLESGDQMYFSREKCFLYGICLKKVELSHILSIGMYVDYELTDDGKHVQGVWAGSTYSVNPSSLLSKLSEWCEAHSVPKATADLLVTDAGWLPPELDPTIDFGEEKEVVDLS